MQDEKYIIFKMVEEGKISAVEAMALIEALEAKEDSASHAKETGGDTESKAGAQDFKADEESNWSAFSKEIGEQIKESVQIAVKNMPYLAEELKDSWGSVKEDVKRSLSEVRDEVNKGIAIDIGGIKRVLYRGRPEFSYVDEIRESWTSEHGTPNVTFMARNGSIAVKGWDKPYFQITVRKQVRGIVSEDEAKRLADDAVKVDWNNDKLDVVVTHHDRVSASIEAFLPEERLYHLEAATRNGALIIEGLNITKTKSTTTNGGITVKDISADRIDISTTNGRILCDNVDGDEVYVTTTNGGIVWKGRGEQVVLRTTNGTVRAEPEALEDTSRLVVKTANASIKVALPGEDDLALDVRAAGSPVDTGDFAHVEWSIERGDVQSPTRVRGKSAGFDHAHRKLFLDLETSNGRVDLRSKSGGH